MHPVMILIPAAALILGPRAWANFLLRKHNRKALELSVTAGEFARDILDRRQLQIVKVESTDVVDHYDHLAKAVRISRNRIDRKTLTALTTAAHEVAHALQDASGYAPFVWRTHFAKIAQVTGRIGSVMLVAVPLFYLTARKPFPFFTMGATVFVMLGTGLIAQLAALPSELDASFNRALPMLRNECIDEEQIMDARIILIACSTTYIASSMVSVLHFWPWFISGALAAQPVDESWYVSSKRQQKKAALVSVSKVEAIAQLPNKTLESPKLGAMEPIVRRFGKSLIRCWIKLARAL